MKFNTDEINEKAEEDFEKTWTETVNLLPTNTSIKLNKKGKPHPVQSMVEESRRILLNLGFEEVINKTIIPETEVYQQYGPEAPVILDRAFYLAKLPRPDVGLSKDKIKRIERITNQELNVQVMKSILRSYKKGGIESDDLLETLVTELGIEEEEASQLLKEVFPEFVKLEPRVTSQTLRSHMTAGWYSTLKHVMCKKDFPISLFSVGPRYRNEQKEDASHLRVHSSASIVVMDPSMSLKAGREVTKRILREYGFNDFKFVTKKATSKYYAKGCEEEVFIKHEGEWLEVADLGMYSPISLSKYGIEYPVFNVGFGIERLVMILEDYEDIRRLVHSQFFMKEYTSEEVMNALTYDKKPKTKQGDRIAEGIKKTMLEKGEEPSPTAVTAYEDDRVKVELFEDEQGQELIGPAALNKVFVKDASVYAYKEELDDSISTGLEYAESLSYKIARMIEEGLEEGNKQGSCEVGMARSLKDVNLKLPKEVEYSLISEHKEFKVGGPIFLKVRYEVKE